MRNVLPRKAHLIPAEATRVFKGVIFDVYQWQQEMFDGSFETFEMLKRPDTIKVIAVKDDKIVILQEEQPAYGSFCGVPGGRHDFDDESELDAAKREVAEESGFTFSTWKLLDVWQSQPKIDHFVYYFLATDFEKEVERHLDPGEKIDVQLLDFDSVKEIVKSGQGRDIGEKFFAEVDSLEELLALPEYIP